GWGLGLEVFGSGSTAWVGHSGGLDGTDCHVRLDPLSGCVVAYTSNALTGGMWWYELADELRRAGLPIRDGANIEWLERPMAPPPGCVGSYLNGKSEILVEATDTGALSLAGIDGVGKELILFEDLSFSIREKPSIRGRFLRDPITGDVELIQIDIWTYRRQSRK
ncbi:MAG: hypothetical protein LC799_06340, partial [Actinobacteria bacterium]|nr:hypothetical protein [Actinomycetota bacterium]